MKDMLPDDGFKWWEWVLLCILVVVVTVCRGVEKIGKIVGSYLVNEEDFKNNNQSPHRR